MCAVFTFSLMLTRRDRDSHTPSCFRGHGSSVNPGVLGDGGWLPAKYFIELKEERELNVALRLEYPKRKEIS